ncbi:hypothetical protein GH714_028281 [Hevea brasiliensis]|uniref:F-box domain-containing protein n=1 Tax=Hevea brasiliensis TaxID=3981 RepID=A0A6A6N8N8_HEVBR|nr:hypothetical protein GH714_028281 [Hevea brasiliensis]
MEKSKEAVDYISELPEPILHHILSFLPIKEIARTSALSKTWFQAWKTVPILKIDFPALMAGNRDRYTIQNLGLGIGTFRWIGYALESNVKHLKIRVGRTKVDEKSMYCMPQAILNAISIQVLDLSHCKLHLPSTDNVTLPFLKKLS